MWCLATLGATATLDPLRVAVLSGHDPTAWSNASCTSTSRGRIGCNLRMYEAAVEAAAAQNVSLLVMPEGYGLSDTHATEDFFEPLISTVGMVPAAASTSPQQTALAAAAARHRVAIVANIFVALANGTRRIVDVVYAPNGTCLATYSKHHLFATEKSTFTAGPFLPTTFALGGHTFGLIICYEGVWPDLSHDWSQMQSLVAQGASAFVWSVGGHIPLDEAGGRMARRFNVSMLASEDNQAGVVLGADGSPGAYHDVHLTVPGYDVENVAVRVSTVFGRGAGAEARAVSAAAIAEDASTGIYRLK